MSALTAWSALNALLGVGLMVTWIGALGTFVLLIVRIAELNRDGDRRLPRFPGSLLFLWPSDVFEWLGMVVDRSCGVEYLRVDLWLARASTALFAGFYLLVAVALASNVFMAMSQ